MIEEVEAFRVVNLITNTSSILKPNLILGGTGMKSTFSYVTNIKSSKPENNCQRSGLVVRLGRAQTFY